jgi:hypothetical protein
MGHMYKIWSQHPHRLMNCRVVGQNTYVLSVKHIFFVMECFKIVQHVKGALLSSDLELTSKVLSALIKRTWEFKLAVYVKWYDKLPGIVNLKKKYSRYFPGFISVV